MDIESLEVKLYSYFSDIKKENYYIEISNKLEKQIKIISEKIKNKDFETEIKLKHIEYGVRVQSNSNFSSIENSIIKAEENLIDECRRLQLEYLKIREKLYNIALKKINIGSAIKVLDSKYKIIINNAYKNKIKVPKSKRVQALKELKKHI